MNEDMSSVDDIDDYDMVNKTDNDNAIKILKSDISSTSIDSNECGDDPIQDHIDYLYNKSVSFRTYQLKK